MSRSDPVTKSYRPSSLILTGRERVLSNNLKIKTTLQLKLFEIFT